MMKVIKLIILNFIVSFLAYEIKSFFEMGGVNNHLAYQLFKIIVLVGLQIALINYRKIMREFVNKFDELATPIKKSFNCSHHGKRNGVVETDTNHFVIATKLS